MRKAPASSATIHRRIVGTIALEDPKSRARFLGQRTARCSLRGSSLSCLGDLFKAQGSPSLNTRIAKDAVQLRGYVDLARGSALRWSRVECVAGGGGRPQLRPLSLSSVSAGFVWGSTKCGRWSGRPQFGATLSLSSLSPFGVYRRCARGVALKLRHVGGWWIRNENVACTMWQTSRERNFLHSRPFTASRSVTPLQHLLLEHATRPSQLGEQTGERGA